MFWEEFERRWGPSGEEPFRYWRPSLGHWCHLRPRDLDDLTPRQMDACLELIEQATKS